MLNEFGGDWTKEKLDCLKNYLLAYVRILRKGEYYRISYIDAFAGSGLISPENNQTVDELKLFEDDSQDVENYLDGSTKIALSINPGFHQYVFIEKNAKRVIALQNLKNEFPEKANKIQIIKNDANIFLSELCLQQDYWNTNRAVVFLDPFGMQVEWPLLEKIAETKAIDLWILFPVNSVLRLLTNGKEPPASWSNRLTTTFGSDEWKTHFYEEKQNITFFGDEIITCRNVTLEKISKHFIYRLRSIFHDVTEKPLILCNSKNSPLYLLFFAAGNPKGGPTAVRIASDIINKKSRRLNGK